MESEINLESKLSVPPRVMARLVGDETVLRDLKSGIYFGLYGVGKQIWESVSEGNNLAQAVTIIVAEYKVDEAQAQTDVIEFVSELLTRGLLVE